MTILALNFAIVGLQHIGCFTMIKIYLLLLLPLLFSKNVFAKFKFYTLEYPPYSCLANGKVTGVAVVYVQEIAARLKIEAEITIVPWARALAQAQIGLIDGIFPSLQTKDREGYLFFPKQQLFQEEIVLVGRKASIDQLTGKLSDLRGKKICAGKGFSLGSAMDQGYANGEWLRIDREVSHDCLGVVQNGDVDFYATDKLTITAIRNNRPDKFKNLSISSVSYAVTPTYLAITKNSQLFSKAAEISLVIEDLQNSSSFQKVLAETLKACR